MRRIAIPAAVALLGLVSQPAGAKPPLLEDPRGDTPVAVGDIVSADITTILRGERKLVITMSLAAPPSTSTPYSYYLWFVAGTCRFFAVYFGHPVDAFQKSAMGCDDGNNNTPYDKGNATVSGTSITWTVPLSGEFKPGAVIRKIRAGTQPGGMSSNPRLEAAGDTGTTDKTYRIGS
ncbi:MAG TPA: hypothetical protein VNA12_07200 [Mycobacteriales bacterium]|nr:hypothetical protein [Mycobacteriales bacterium]